VKNRYVNKDEEGTEGDAASDEKHDAPPPTDAEFRQKMSSGAVPPSQNRGMFNRAKTRGIYISLFFFQLLAF